MQVKRLTQLSLLTAMALIIFIIELRIPNIVLIPGVKLGLANIVTVYAVYRFSASEVSLLILVRILLGAMFSGNAFSLIYSITGAFFCFCGMLLIKRFISQKYIWLSSILGAVLHNTGQILAAIFVMKTYAVIAYYPILIVSGCIAGFFTGLCAQLVLKRTLYKRCNFN
ncbi:MAG: Gx transporter family protein [Hominimerdicola sp.]